MNIPETVNIGGLKYEVRLVDNVTDSDHNVDGQINYGKVFIKIKKDMSPQYLAKVFLHEIMHAVFDHCQLSEDERIVERITNCLYQVLHDNRLHFDED